MEIRNGGEALKTLLGVSSTVSSSEQPVRNQNSDQIRAAFAGDQATFSKVGTKVSDAASDDGIRMDRVAAVQAALAAGTYRVDSVKVAERVIEAMRAGGVPPEK